jgi:hypothetical protein
VAPQGAADGFGAHVSTSFPPFDRPEVFGVHFNARQLTAKEEGASLLQRLTKAICLTAEREDKPLVGEYEEKAQEWPAASAKRQRTKINDVLVKVPDLLPDDELGEQRPSCFAALLRQEIERYNHLLHWIQQRCQHILSCLEAEEALPDDVSVELFDYIMCDRTPTQWQVNSYPCLSSLPAYLSDLQERVAYIRGLLQQQVDDFYCFWVPGFFSQRRLLSLLLHHEARGKQLPLDAVTFKYRVTSLADSATDSSDRARIETKLRQGAAKQGYYFYGLTC